MDRDADLWGFDKRPSGASCQKEVETYNGLSSDLIGTGSPRYFGMTLREWEFWTW